MVEIDKRTYIPNSQIYKDVLAKLIEKDDLTTLIAIRMGCEMGLSRIEIVNSRVSDIDRINKRGLWVEVAKRVRRGKKIVDGEKKSVFKMRQREIPINNSLYQLIKAYANHNQKFILQREKGDITIPFIPRYINTLYELNEVPWSSHKSRHFFKAQVWSWMQKNRQVDPGLLKEYLGHKKSTTENYGEYSWDYKLEVLDKVFE